ncbi:hypothetical protein G7Z17_g2330 [Cylindrodendrum hubeiense]|uniref:Methyltransferase n=1 Tax=Cylindrodendrum hubeiense TaxID=595255 RepID=A0A9P5LJA2_9HYPO|nr:hypothetical protein G7Z17_g2330 [Cylindrodendrum hubeiense]
MAAPTEQPHEPLIADRFDDVDSAISVPTTTAGLISLRSSIWQFQEENGRTYHAMSSGRRLGLSPKIEGPTKRVLDAGTGTGIWAIENLEPGGYLEMQDLTHPLGCDDGTMPDHLELCRLGHLCIEASKKAGRPIDVAPKYKTFLKKAGFVDIVEKRFKWPLNEWPKDAHYKEIGAWSFENLNTGLEGLLLALFTRFLGWTREEVFIFCSATRKQLQDRRIHAYIPLYVVYGRKPGDRDDLGDDRGF